MKNINYQAQRGSTLIVAIILLLLLSVVTYLGVQTGMFEQRTSTSDVRAKVVHQVAEAGLNQAVEHVRLLGSTFLPGSGESATSTRLAGKWTECGRTDSSFPCGAEADLDRREQMYAFSGGTDITTNAAPTEVDVKSLPLGQSFTAVGNFPVTYSVGALLCLVDSATTGAGKTAKCTRNFAASVTNAVKLVSTGLIEGEAARATVTVTVGTYRIINTPPSLPPVVASSVIAGLGNATIVANPNGGGKGVPLSVWTRGYLGALGNTASGSYQTCEADEFFRSDDSTTLASTGALLCDNCACPSAAKISVNGTEGKDSLDRDDTDSGVNKAVDATLSPAYQFPCDLFAYVFGTKARNNVVATDPFSDVPALCETLAPSTIGGTSNVQDYLNANFKRVNDCDTLVTSASTGGTNDGGFYWMPNGCSLSGLGHIGSPQRPVVMVVDSSFKDSGPTIYGLVFVRDPATTYASPGAGAAEYGTGGGTAVIYGAVVIEGAGALNGGLKIVSSPQTLARIGSDPNNIKFARVPGTWNDSLTY